MWEDTEGPPPLPQSKQAWISLASHSSHKRGCVLRVHVCSHDLHRKWTASMERHGAGVFSPIGDAGKGFGHSPRLLVPVRGVRE